MEWGCVRMGAMVYTVGAESGGEPCCAAPHWTFVPQNIDGKLGFTDAGCAFRESWQGGECVSFITVSFWCLQVLEELES